MNMFNVTSSGISKEIETAMSAFTSIVDKLTKSAEKARTEASAKREKIKELDTEVKALDNVADSALTYANKIKNIFN